MPAREGGVAVTTAPPRAEASAGCRWQRLGGSPQWPVPRVGQSDLTRAPFGASGSVFGASGRCLAPPTHAPARNASAAIVDRRPA
eukprot:CAMPEP_0117694932 /NCGR_PEP_ID=MMETSP0804-20121206/27786_1 /TAXON_ID=1074897 /ORGANISM="Tetraselmis astigmatica, Strain CCMP880" /LENGTH=84 /DNA_ID=CAMNT_0005508803 /DNA_START=420 /DNA_END=671 /DNA_ORIENTATION=-